MKNMQYRLDLRGTIVPFSLLKVCQAFKLMDTVWSDPDTQEDLFKVLPASSYDLISLDETKDGQSAYRLTLLKKRL